MTTEHITVHPLTKQPTQAWQELSKTQKFFKINYRPPKAPNKDPKKVRVVCMSDTHSLYHYIKFDVPDGDIFIHAGNFTAGGKPDEVAAFNSWLGRLPHRHKLVIAGNHELTFDPNFKFDLAASSRKHDRRPLGEMHNRAPPKTDGVRELLTNGTLLEDSGVELFGIKFYGTPWQPAFGPWAFGLPRGEDLLAKWNRIPAGTDVLITHTPPVGFCDRTARGEHAGCVELLATIQRRVRPKYAIFGHVHDAYGVMTDGRTVFVNASTCDINYKPNNFPVVFDVEVRGAEAMAASETHAEKDVALEIEAEKAVVVSRGPWLYMQIVARYLTALMRRMVGIFRRY